MGAGIRWRPACAKASRACFISTSCSSATCGEKADFGSITAEVGHYFGWREIWPEALQDYRPPLAVERDQERLVQGMLSRENLLTILRTCTVFMDTDTGQRVKVVCRYQQFQAARRVVERLCQGRQSEERGGVVWHTQGSGKSLTMVFVVRMLRASADLNDFKIVLVNDRTDPDKVNTGIAFLIVCDMLLTGFVAPIEQVMYIDKKFRSTACCRPLRG